MKKRYMIFGCAAAVVIASTSIGGAWSYFTTYAEASGGRTVSLGDVTDIEEPSVDRSTKTITISNTENSQPVYVRVAVYAGDEYKSALAYRGQDDSWTVEEDADGYLYYKDPVAGGTSTKSLYISMDKIYEKLLKETEDFNVIVVYESTPVVYDQNGDPVGYENVDWTQTVDTGTAGGE